MWLTRRYKLYAISLRCFSFQITDSHLNFFKSVLGKNGLVTEESQFSKYNTDWLRIFHGKSRTILLPESTEQVSELLDFCSQHKIPVIPQGGNTGLVGGSIPIDNEVVLSMEKMNRIFGFNEELGSVTVEAGAILANVDDFCARHNRIFPLEIGSKGSCQIGGNLATNAGGMRQFRFGSLHSNTIGLEVILSDGRILNSLKPAVRKNNTGYHINNLFIGSEGTLGVITKANIFCPIRPSAVKVMLVICKTFSDAVQLLYKSRGFFGSKLSAFEFMDKQAVDCVVENLKLPFPFKLDTEFAVIIETMCYSPEENVGHVDFMDEMFTNGIISNGTIAENQKQERELWSFRERCAEALLVDGYNYKYDLSVPLSGFYQVVNEIRDRLESFHSKVRTVAYGHLADSNLHLNVTCSSYSGEVERALEPFIYERTAQLGGSISAEHGVGQRKRDLIHLCKSENEIQIMRELKRFFDPACILNPDKVVPKF